MPVQPGSLGGRSDVVLPAELANVPRWRPVSNVYAEAAEVGSPDDFPTRGVFVEAELLDGETYNGHDHLWLAVTEGLDGMLAEHLEGNGGLDRLTVKVDAAEKGGSEETSPWRYTASVVPEDELGPPED